MIILLFQIDTASIHNDFQQIVILWEILSATGRL